MKINTFLKLFLLLFFFLLLSIIAINNDDANELRRSFEQSLVKLNRDRVYGLLMHDCNDLFKPGGEKLFKENEYHLYLFYNILFRDLFNGENIGIKKISKKISLLDDIIFEFDWKIYELGINNDQQNYYIREF